MKKTLALLLVAVMAFAMVACNAQSNEKPDANKVYKVAMICDSSISDGGWGAACYNAMVTAAEARGWEHAYTDSIDVADYVSAMESYCSLGYDMIFLPGNQYSDATVEVAANYPDIKFAVLNGTDKIISDNIAAILPDADQIGYLAGGLAGLMSKSGVIGFIGGMELDTTKKKLAGFEKAAQHFNPDIVVKSAYAGSFNDTAKGMELAKAMIGEGADVFFGDASAVDSGARQAIDQANTAGVNIFDIGQPADILGQNPCIICSVVTDNAGMLGLCMDDVMNGTFGNKVVYGTLENNCLAPGKLNADLVPQEIQDQYLAFVEEVKNGTFK
jgi:basic membrane protein A